ncbi:hypothetical protein TNCV_1370661 [Trichonephila clavipes]|nr:hypothetical protein TNCV_1370661 [Trichonephila clavipes]
MWRRSIARLITKKEMQVEAYKIVRSLLVETDEAAFDIMLKEALKMFDEKEEMKEFKMYFEQTYSKQRSMDILSQEVSNEIRKRQSIRSTYFFGESKSTTGTRQMHRALTAIVQKNKDQILAEKEKLCFTIRNACEDDIPSIMETRRSIGVHEVPTAVQTAMKLFPQGIKVAEGEDVFKNYDLFASLTAAMSAVAKRSWLQALGWRCFGRVMSLTSWFH